MTQELLARVLGNVFGGALFLAIGYGVAIAMRNRRGGGGALPRWPLIIGGLVALLSITASVTRTVYAYYQTAPLKPMIMRQPAQGLTDADITPEYAEEVREALTSQTNAKMPEGTGEVGGGSAAVMTVGDRRFGVVHMAVNGIESVVTVFGIRGDEFVRVTCIEEGVADYRTPECASAIKGALDVQLP